MLTGFNTDVEYDGVVYHVQTEDKGLQTPFILSLVYSGGAILASKRSPYNDLVAGGFDEGVLALRLSRQHKLICAAVHAGRIDDLKRMGERDQQENAARRQSEPTPQTELVTKPAADEAAETAVPVASDPVDEVKAEAEAPDPFANSGSDKDSEPLRVMLLEEPELVGGKSVTLRVLVSRAGQTRREPARKARIVVKTLGTNFRPTSNLATTNAQGVAAIAILLPSFESGRAAVLIQAHTDGETAELRRIIQPAKAS